jgi:hypothetical protein
MTILAPPVQTLLTLDPIGAAVAATGGPVVMPLIGRHEAMALQATFLYGAGGTTVKAYVQTTFDGEVSWTDIACFAFTTSAARRLYNLNSVTVPSIVTPSDGALADNTAVSGLLGPVYRVKYVTTGTYTGATSLSITAQFR